MSELELPDKSRRRRKLLGFLVVTVGWVVASGAFFIGCSMTQDMDPPYESPKPYFAPFLAGLATAYIGHRILRPVSRPWTND